MTSEIRTNTLTSRAGLSTVTLTDSGPMFSGITTFVDNSTFSVGTGGTIHAPATNVMALGTNNIDAIKIDSSGNVNVTGILTASSFSGIDSDKISEGNTEAEVVDTGSDGHFKVTTEGTERLRIASDGHIFFANEAGGIDTTARLGEGHRLQLSGLSSNDGISVVRYNTSYGAWGFNLGRSRSGTLGTNTILANNDDIGHITFWGADGSDFNQAAQISAQVDGSPSDGTDMPGRLVFKTSADGSGTPSERLRITSTGFVGINENSPSRHLHVNSGSSDIIAVFESSDTSAQIQIKDSTGTCTIECLNDFRFQNGSAEILRLKSDKDVQVMDGNLILASGHGIDFSATPNGYAGSINETFDDYEEGYFTPTVGGWSASGTGVYGSGGQRGRYTKVGNLVTIFFHVYWTALNNASGVFAIENLPFAHTSSTTNLSTAVQMRYVDYSGDTVFAVGGNGYSSSLLFYAQNDNGNHNYVPVDSNGGRIEGCVTYITDS